MITSQYSGRTELVRDFVNIYDVEADHNKLGTSSEPVGRPARTSERSSARAGEVTGCRGVHRGGDGGRLVGSAEGVRGENGSVGVHRRVENSITIMVFHEGLR
jgi:hypothetical protein